MRRSVSRSCCGVAVGVVSVGIALALGGCQASKPAGSRGAATPAQSAAAIDQLKALAGTWDVVGADGKPGGTSTFNVSSAGSVVREVMFVGTEHEMTNMYHMDGDSLVVTHYCAMGNQPRMRARPADIKRGSIDFKFDSATNFDPKAGGALMGDLRLTMTGPDELRQQWTSYQDGKPAEHADFQLRRRR